MPHVVYETSPGSERVELIATRDTFRSAAAAQRARARRNAKSPYAQDRKRTVQVAELSDYQSQVRKMVKVRNLMTGAEVEEPNDTPHYCSVSSETYWSA